MQSATLIHAASRSLAHPNDLDRKRIERAMKARKRYRYVTPKVSATVGGPTPASEYKIGPAFIETFLLLTSSFAFGGASIAMRHEMGRAQLLGWMALTLLLGIAFLN